MKHPIAWIAAAACLACATAHAQVAGNVLIRGGATQISPQVTSGNLSSPSFPNSQVDVESSTRLSGGLTYMLTNHLSVDVPVALPFKHDIVGAGAVQGVGKIGETKVLPFTVFAQYRFLEPASAFRPYLGIGLTYSKFFKERTTAALNGLTGGAPGTPTTMSIDDKFGITPQVGVSYMFNERWFVDAAYQKTFVKTTTTLSSGQQIRTKLNPNTVSLSVGYRF